MYINTPITRPPNYNTTLHPLAVDFVLDPECQYTISVQNSFGQTASRIFQQFSHWIPAHLAAILFLALRHQIALTPSTEPFKCGSLNSAYLASSTFLILSGKSVARHDFYNNF